MALDPAGLPEDLGVALQLGVVADDRVTVCRRTLVHGWCLFALARCARLVRVVCVHHRSPLVVLGSAC